MPVLWTFEQFLLQVFLLRPAMISFPQTMHGVSFLFEILRQTNPQNTLPLLIWQGLRYIGLLHMLHPVFVFLMYVSAIYLLYQSLFPHTMDE